MNWYGQCSFAIHVHNLIKIEISKMTALRNSLVYDWQLIHSLVLVWSFQWCVLCLFLSRASIPWYCIRVYNATNYNILAAFFSIIKALLCKNSKISQNSILESYMYWEEGTLTTRGSLSTLHRRPLIRRRCLFHVLFLYFAFWFGFACLRIHSPLQNFNIH